MKPFVVTGTGRSGTGYISRLLTALGARCGHEAIFHPATQKPVVNFGPYQGDASWLAAPWIPQLHPDVVVLHQTRDPIDVARSHLGIHFFHDDADPSYRPYQQFVRNHSDVYTHTDPLERFMRYWILWNENVERLCADRSPADHLRYRVEDLTPELVSRILALLGRSAQRTAIVAALTHCDPQYNHRRRDDTVAWEMLPECALREPFLVLAQRYGYSPGQRSRATPHPEQGSTSDRLARALSLYQSGQLTGAERICQSAARSSPENAAAWHLWGLIALRQGMRESATERLTQATELAPQRAEYHSHLAEAHRTSGDLAAAVAAGREALRLDTQLPAAHNNLGLALQAQGELDAAASCFHQALNLRPDYAKACFNLGNVLREQGRLDEAESRLRESLRLNPRYPEALNSLGATLLAQRRLDASSDCYQQAIRLRPTYRKAWLNLLKTSAEQDRHEDRARRKARAANLLPFLRHAARLVPEAAEPHFLMGNALAELEQTEDAFAAYRQALQREPDSAMAHFKIGNLWNAVQRWEEAVAAYRRAVELDPNLAEALANLEKIRAELCDWQDRTQQVERLMQSVTERLAERRPCPLNPHAALFFPFTMEQHLKIARLACDEAQPAVKPVRDTLQFTFPHPTADRIRIGYLSADFRDHAVSHLIQGVFGLHDRQQFEVFAYSYGPDDGSRYRQTIQHDCDHFVDIAAATMAEAARRIHADGVHILVDLMGHTGNARPEIVALRPAPIQVNYLGHPGTMGDFADYIILDNVLAPEGWDEYFSEQVVRLPHSYQANAPQPIDKRTVTPEEEGLPPEAFVFCCFNNSFKIEPIIFDVWMRILAETPGSVLWLLARRASMRHNLAREAANRGIDPQRLIFARSVSKAKHLARHRLADLFLDTPLCNAHTTASDSLWAGLPPVTCLGETFASRVAASLLTAIGLPELITSNLEDYQRLALELAHDRDQLERLRAKLVANRVSEPLFDTPRMVRNLERAYQQMWQRHAAGELPAPITVEEC